MAVEEFRLPLSSYDELVKIIRGYGHFNDDVELNEIAGVAGVHPTIVSRNNAFLIAVGIITSGKSKGITPPGKALALALEHNMPEEVAQGWRDLLLPNPFFQKLIAAIKIRRGMDFQALQAHVAYSAGQKKSPAVMAGSAAIVQIMFSAALIREDDAGKVVVVDDPSTATPTTFIVDAPAELTPSEPASGFGVSAPRVVSSAANLGGVQVVIQLQVQCTPDQLDDVAEKLTSLVEKVRAGKTATE